ncbi:alpha/beta hydrolase [uncultured Roseibium sp.]|uniref:alpha/beta hydrolase n=1 Tax=uncultured Roseibium sp. TaxID=1936171 RepID=UPI002612655F|nr:alpha/beta hydrolase [uncultured Roseibium sp.]
MTGLMPTDADLIPTERMQWILDRLAKEDSGLGDPTLLPAPEGRELAEQTNTRWNSDLPEMSVRELSIEAPEGHSIQCRLMSPENADGLIMFVHGGGWAFCSMATHDRAARLLALEAGAHVLTFDYRLAPEAPFPAGLMDCKSVWAAVTAGNPDLAACSGPRALAGDSAGANLAQALLLMLQEEQLPAPDAALLFYGVYDANFETASYLGQKDGPGLTRAKMMRYWDWYVAGAADRMSPLVSPLQASDEQLRKLPPLFLNAAAIDPLRSDTENLVRRLRSLGRTDPYTLYPGVVHGFMQMSLELPEARKAAAEAGRAFRELTGS